MSNEKLSREELLRLKELGDKIVLPLADKIQTIIDVKQITEEYQSLMNRYRKYGAE